MSDLGFTDDHQVCDEERIAAVSAARSEAAAEWLRLLDIAIWGFDGEPHRCSRCNAERFTEDHSPTCRMSAEVIRPANKLIDRDEDDLP